MKSTRICLLGAALAAAAALGACGSPEPSSLIRGKSNDPSSGEKNGGADDKSGASTPGAPATPGTLPTNSEAGKAFFASTVDPFLEQKCSGCHVEGGIGNPTWIAKGDAAKTYEMIYAQSFATAASRIVIKGIHSGGSAPELTPDQKSKWAEWIAIELKDGGTKAQASVLEKFGTCFDKAKFDAIGFENLRTIRRQPGNNLQNQIENPDPNTNECTGCNDAPCRTCHSADDVTGFVMAVGNTIFPEDYTFQQSKLLNPSFIRAYVSTTPSGGPQFNPGILSKSINTVEKAKAYQHPMFKLTPAMTAAIQGFVDDAVTKYNAGTCGK